jgi:hypothetical protein
VLGYQAVADGLASEDASRLAGAKATLAQAQNDLTRWGQQVLDLARTNPTVARCSSIPAGARSVARPGSHAATIERVLGRLGRRLTQPVQPSRR